MDCTVVIPTRGRPDYLKQAIESVKRQSYKAAEIIVVLDGPDPEVCNVSEAVGCRVLSLDASHGVSAARNAGMRAARTRWIAFLDDDDLWHPDRLAHTASHLSDHPQCRAVQAPYYTFSADADAGAELAASTLDDCLAAEAAVPPDRLADMGYLNIFGRSYELLLERNRGVISTATMELSLVQEAGGFDDSLAYAEDWMLFLAIARLTEWHLIDRRLSFVRKHAANNTSTNPTNGLTTLRAISKVWQRQDAREASHPRLANYGATYRWTVQDAVWRALRRRDVQLARAIWRTGKTLLPKRVDRVYVGIPPQVTWRIEHRRGR